MSRQPHNPPPGGAVNAEYGTWEDLLEDEADEAGDAPGSASPVAPELPPSMQALLVKKEKLERELAALSGKGEKSAEQKRHDLMFPLPTSTPEQRAQKRHADRKHRLTVERAQAARKQMSRARRLLAQPGIKRSAKRPLPPQKPEQKSLLRREAWWKEQQEALLARRRQEQIDSAKRLARSERRRLELVWQRQEKQRVEQERQLQREAAQEQRRQARRTSHGRDVEAEGQMMADALRRESLLRRRQMQKEADAPRPMSRSPREREDEGRRTRRGEDSERPRRKDESESRT